MRVTVRVPATSANLGPGFDCFGLALDLCNEVTVDTEAEPGVTWDGEGADELPTDGSDMVSRAIAFTWERRARIHPGANVPAVALRGVNRIPLERGLGSSSASAVAGVAIANALFEGGATGATDDPSPIYKDAAEIEGHPDNAAAASYGGFTIVADGFVRRLEPHPALDPSILVPDSLRSPTDAARRTLRREVSRRDAVFNVGHAALAVLAFTTDPDLLAVALQDRLHEDARLVSVPDASDLLHDLRHRQRIPACVSGAGPSLIAFASEGQDIGELPDGWRVLRPGIRARGVEVHRHP